MNFHLYLVLPQNIPEGERFYLVTAKYCLLYTEGEAPKGAREITKISSLPHLAKEWLAGCIDRLREAALEEQKDRLLSETGPAFYAAFEEALSAERERVEGSTAPHPSPAATPSPWGEGFVGTDSSAAAGASAQNDNGDMAGNARRYDNEKEDGEA